MQCYTYRSHEHLCDAKCDPRRLFWMWWSTFSSLLLRPCGNHSGGLARAMMQNRSTCKYCKHTQMCALKHPLLKLKLISCFTCPPRHNESEKRLPKSCLVVLCKFEPVLRWTRECDNLLYQTLVEILIPDVLRPIPSKLIMSCRNVLIFCETHLNTFQCCFSDVYCM